ncbi:hypothetical protein ABZ312_41055 [Streptomyces sp. NPDC006207]
MPGSSFEVITGAEALRRLLQKVQDDARQEVAWFCKAQYVAMSSGSNRAEIDALRRGVRYRVLYERAFFDDEGVFGHVVEAAEAGEVARSVPHLPLRLAVVDRSIAICPLVTAGAQSSPGEATAALVRGSILLQALISLFERYWETSVPLKVAATGEDKASDGVASRPTLSRTHRQLLSLLMAGVADRTIVGQMGLSQRTFQRQIQQLMNLAGADTRMQLAWQAARRGWLG